MEQQFQYTHKADGCKPIDCADRAAAAAPAVGKHGHVVRFLGGSSLPRSRPVRCIACSGSRTSASKSGCDRSSCRGPISAIHARRRARHGASDWNIVLEFLKTYTHRSNQQDSDRLQRQVRSKVLVGGASFRPHPAAKVQRDVQAGSTDLIGRAAVFHGPGNDHAPNAERGHGLGSLATVTRSCG
jgi:hypothetical protein